MVSKRKRAPPAQPPLQQTAPSLKEYIWNELLLVLRKHSYVSLTGKRPSDMAMGNFRCVTIAIGEIHVDNPSCRARIWSSLQSHIQMMASAAQPCPGDPVTDAEFRRVALTVAYAIANPREFYSFFMSFSIYLININQVRRSGISRDWLTESKIRALGQMESRPRTI
jgi:hypothetical protein